MQLKLFFVLQCLYQIFAYYTLYYEAFNDQTFELGNWNMVKKISGNIQTTSMCGNTQLFGGYQILGENSLITNLIKLRPHSSIRISLDFWKIDNWNPSDQFTIFLDDQALYQNSATSPTMNDICGNTSQQELVITIDQTINHNFNSALIIIYTSLSTNQGFWGVRNFNLYIQECPQGCQVCNTRDSLSQCIKWKLAYESLTDTNLILFNTNHWQVKSQFVGPFMYLCQNIPVLCGYHSCGSGDSIINQIQLPSHSKIKVHFRFFKIDSWDNEEAVVLIDHINSWKQIFSPLENYFLCGSTGHKEKNLNIEINMSHISPNVIIEIKSNLNETSDNESFGIRDVLIFVNSNNCDEIYDYQCCGDIIKQIGEDCDDGNIIPFDGCHNCQFSCPNGCSSCVRGQCFECQDGYIMESNLCYLLTITYYDGIIQSSGIYLPFYYIVVNSFTKCNDRCSFCYLGKCERCDYGFSLNDGHCISLCGDFLVNKEQIQGKYIEECDNPYSEGCVDCHIKPGYKCVQEDISICWTYDEVCLECDHENNNINSIDCPKGYYSDVNLCLLCDPQCITCESQSNMCIEYNSENTISYNSTESNENDQQNENISKCGDGIVSQKTEQCDDGNIENSDGCSSKCQYEFLEQPKLKAEIKIVYLSTEIILLSFSQKVKRGQSIEEYDKMIIATISNVTYDLSITPIQQANTYLNWVQFEIQVVINQNLNYEPYLEIKLDETLYNEYNLSLSNQITKVKLKKTYSLTDEQKLSTQRLVGAQNKVTYTLASVLGVLILTGGRVAVWAALEILQQQSYLKFINVIYPQNLETYFNASIQVNLQPILNYLIWNVSQITQYYSFNQQLANDKFKFYEVDSNILLNISSSVFSFLSFLLMKFGLQYFYSILIYLNWKFKGNFTFAKSLRRLKLNVKKVNREVQEKGLRQLQVINSWEITFISFLQLSYGGDNKLLNVFALVLLALFFLLIIPTFRGSKKGQSKRQYWDEMMDIFLVLKKMCFMSVIVACQQNSFLQINLLGLINSLHFIMLIKLKIFSEQKEFIKAFVTETSLIIYLLSIQLYCEDAFVKLTQDQKIIVGWFNIGCLLSNVVCHLYFDSIEVLQKIIEFIKSNYQKKMEQQINKKERIIQQPVFRVFF